MSNNFNFLVSGYIPGETDFNFGVGVDVYYILKGTSNNFSSIWADPLAGYNSGKFYVSSSDTLSIIDAAVESVYDWYTQTYGGRGNEALDSNDSIDINVGG